MTLSDFLSRVKVDKSKLNEIIPISFDLQEVLQENIIFVLSLKSRQQVLL